MLSVEQAVRDLRREILAGAAGDVASTSGDGWTVDRMTFSLGVRLRGEGAAGSGPGGWEVHSGPGPAPHQVTVELSRPGRGGVGGDGVSAASPAPAGGVSASSMAGCLAGLAEVFGAPGFDSAARATVFRETLQPLDESDRRKVLASLGAGTAVELDPSLNLAQHLLRRLAGSGPAGPKDGPERLRCLADRFPVAELIRVAAERWRTQSDWAAGAGGDPTTGP